MTGLRGFDSRSTKQVTQPITGMCGVRGSVLLMPSVFFFPFCPGWFKPSPPPFLVPFFTAFLPFSPPGGRPIGSCLPSLSLSPHNTSLSYWRKLGGTARPPAAGGQGEFRKRMGPVNDVVLSKSPCVLYIWVVSVRPSGLRDPDRQAPWWPACQTG